MSRSRNKKNNRNKAVYIQKQQIAELEKQLNELNENYRKQYASFYQLWKENAFCERENTTYKSGDRLHVLLCELLALRDSMDDILQHKNNIFNNEGRLLYIKIQVLSGRVMFSFNERAAGFTYYLNAINVLKLEGESLKYQNDLFFIEQMRSAFVAFEPIWATLSKNTAEHIRDTCVSFNMECQSGNTFIKLCEAHEELQDIYITSDKKQFSDEKFRCLLRNKRESFFAMGKKLQASLENIKADKLLSAEYQIIYMKLNFLMMNISDLTHPRAICKAILVDEKVGCLLPSHISFKEAKDYFNFWLSLKKDYITNSLALIENINIEELNIHTGSYEYLYESYTKSLELWNKTFVRTIGLFTLLTETWIGKLKSLQVVSEKFKKESGDYIFHIEIEKKLLLSNVSVITEAAKKIKHRLDRKYVSETLSYSAELSDKISELKSHVEKLEQEKLKIANETTAELIREETEMQEEKAKKRHLRYLKSLNQFFAEEKQCEPEACEDEDEKVLNTVTLISLELQNLTDIDVAAMKLSAVLKGKSQAMLNFITSRLALPVQLASSNHRDIFLKIRNMLVEYYELIALFEKHKSLSQTSVILREEQLTQGIGFSQDELNERCKVIYQNIQSLLKLIDEIIAQQKKSKKDFIYKLGKENAAPHHSDGEIMRMGEKKLGKIREEKRAKGQEFSEHTKQKDFLNAMKLNFSGFLYLQERIRPHIYDGALCVQGLFGQKEPVIKREGISEGTFESLLGFIFKQQHDSQGDIKCLEKSLLHLQRASLVLKQEQEPEYAQDICDLMAVVETRLNQINYKKLEM